MAPSKDRQRKLARAKLDRQMARQAARERRNRRIYAGVGSSLALVLIVLGGLWVGGVFDAKKTDPDAGDTCLWTAQNAASNTSLKDVGTPPTKGFAVDGTDTMTIKTNQGDPITVSLDVTNAPCSAEDLRYLASKQFYDNTDCHEITTTGALHCGDPSGTGQGGPTYSVYSENLPSAPDPSASPSAAPAATKALYPAGTVALIGDPPGANGSQFLIFFKDYSPATAEYPIVGTVTGGMNTVTKISKIPTKADAAGDKVTPTQKITISSLTVGATASSAAASAAPSASTQP